jgi:lipoate-protein ligase A
MLTFTIPADTAPSRFLSWDEAFLDEAEAGGPEVLWFWESVTPFVVIGYGQKAAKEVDEAACLRREVPVLRRCSGGGTVVQGPGCLNYGLALRIEEHGALATITGANRWIMERQRRAMAALLGDPVQIRGHTDLALATPAGERKFSGNAQRRKRTALLFHGTFLLRFDLGLISDLLRFPSAQPGYRSGRDHLDFVANTGLEAAAVIGALRAEWGAGTIHPSPPIAIAEAAAARHQAPAAERRL